MKAIDISVETDECGFHITNASLDDLEWIIGEDPINAFISRLSPIAPMETTNKMLEKNGKYRYLNR